MTRSMFVACWLVATSAFAEERTFAVRIDGKPAGEVVLSFKPQADGTTAVTHRADVAERPAGFSLSYRGAEVWADRRLRRLDGTGSDTGRKGRVSLAAREEKYALTAGAKDVSVRGEVWPSSYAVLPEVDRQPLVVDVLTGDVSRAKVEKVGADRVTVAGKPIRVTRYRLTVAGRCVELWYDVGDRLVRRQWSQDGRMIVAELTRLVPD